jgi:hypothetical protein
MEAKDLVGSSILIGLTFVESDGSERLESYIGRIVEVGANDESFENLDDSETSLVIVAECHDGGTRTFPFDRTAINPANSGFYELPDGATIEDPDFEMHWHITAPTKH